MNLIINVELIEDEEFFKEIYKNINTNTNETIKNDTENEIFQNNIFEKLTITEEPKLCPDTYFNYKDIKKVRKIFNH